MSGNIQEDTTFLDRCLVVIFKENKRRKSDENQEDLNKDIIVNHCERDESNDFFRDHNVKGATTTKNTLENKEKSKSGKDLYQEFVSQNRGCFWNPHLEESLNNIHVIGYVYPHTLLLGGRDIYLDTIRGAWSRRILQAPLSFTIHKIGEIDHMDMQVTSQAQFTPLPEALCMIISDLNKLNCVTTFEEIIKQLKKKYRGVHQPAEEIVYEALGTLLNERKIYHTGRGYHIITPELFAHVNFLNGCATLQDNRNSILIPLPHSHIAEMCSIAIQTDDLQQDIVQDKTDKEERSHKIKIFERSNSLKESKRTCKEKKLSSQSFTRSSSVRLPDDKGKSLLRDLYLKTSDLHHDQDKGDKSSIFSKIFRSKSKKKHHAMNIEDEVQDEDSGPVEQPSVEYATFSAQFPPAEIQWYETRSKAAVLFQETAANKCCMSKSGTLHYLQKPCMVDAEAQSDIFDYTDIDFCLVHKSKTLPENISGFASAMQSPAWKQSPSAHSKESTNSQGEFLNTSRFFSKPKDRLISKTHRKHKEKRKSRQFVKKIHHVGESQVDGLPYIHHTNNDNCGNPLNNDVTLKHIKSSPNYGNTSEAIYEDIEKCQKNLPKEVVSDLVNENRSPALENFNHNKSSTHQPVNQVKNSCHKNKIYKKYKEMYSQCTTSCNNDVSLEYNLTYLPDKTLSVAKSRESGVNCISLLEVQPCVTIPMSEVSNSLNYSIDIEQPLVGTEPQKYNFPQSKLNFSHNDTKSSHLHNADTLNRNSFLVYKAEVYRNVQPKMNESNIHEDSGINSPKGNFSLHSPNYNRFNHQKPNLLQNYRNNLNSNDFKEQSKDIPSLKNCIMKHEKYSKVLNTSGRSLETDVDQPNLDKYKSGREGSPSQMKEIEDLCMGFHLLSPENQLQSDQLERRPSYLQKTNYKVIN